MASKRAANKRNANLWLEREFLDLVSDRARKLGVSRSEIIKQLLAAWIDRGGLRPQDDPVLLHRLKNSKTN